MSTNKILPSVFIVNLSQCEDRRAHMRDMLDSLSISYEFVDAVDGNQLQDNEIKAVYEEELSELYIGRPLSKAEIGCYMSHIKVFELIKERNIPQALVLEDDVDVSPDMVPFLKQLEQLSIDWEIINLNMSGVDGFFSWYKKRHRIYKDYVIGRPYGRRYGTQGYLIKQSAAKYNLAHAYPIIAPIDHRLFDTYVSFSFFHVVKNCYLVTASGKGFRSIVEISRKKMRNNSYQSNESYLRSVKHKKEPILTFRLSTLLRSLWRLFFYLVGYYFQPNIKKPKPVISYKDRLSLKKIAFFRLSLYFNIMNYFRHS